MKQSIRQFRVLRHGRNIKVALGGLVLLSGELIVPPQVKAGEYVLDHIESADGEVYESESNPTTRPWTGSQPNSASTTKSNISSETSYSVSARSKGKMRTVFVWQPDGPNDNPPQHSVISLNISAYTNVPASVAYGQPAGTLSGLVVNNGFSDLPINQGYGNTYSYVSQGTHLIHIKTDGQTTVSSPFITMEGSVTLTGTTGSSSGSASAGAYHIYSSAKATQQPALAWIESSTIEDSYYKGNINQTNSGVITAERIKHERASDLSIATDSALVFDGENNRWRAGANFEAQSANIINPSYSWTYCGSGTLEGSPPLGYNSQSFALGLYFGSQTEPFPNGKESVLSVTVNGNSGATATNTFGVTWHLPYENFVKTGESLEAWADLVKGEVEEEGQAQSDGNTFVCTFEYDRKYGFADGIAAAGNVFTAAAGAVGAGGDALMGLILAGLGMAIENIDLGLVHANNVVVSQDAWDEAKRHPDFVPDGLIYENAVMVEGYMAIYYDYRYYRYDQYDQHGFVDLQTKTARFPSAKAPVATGNFAAWDDVND